MADKEHLTHLRQGEVHWNTWRAEQPVDLRPDLSGAHLNRANLSDAGQAAGQVVERDPEQLVLLYLCCLQGLAAGMTFYGENLLAHFPDADAVLQLFKP